MVKYPVLIIAVVLLFIIFRGMSVIFHVITDHPLLSVYYGARDFVAYLGKKKWRLCPTGELIAYTALFGRGKTLSVVHYVCEMYNHYNGLRVWDPNRKKWVKQVIHVISNVDLNIPYEKFVSLQQIVYVADNFRKKDEENDTLTCVLVLGDEFSVQLNSRQFKSNIDPLFLNTLLTCRHHHITIVYNAQRFQHVDALLRQVTSYVITCNKVWRVVVHEKYSAWDLENAKSDSLLSPVERFGWFVRDRDYQAYDTLACVGNLQKSCESGDMLSEKEILDLQNPGVQNLDNVKSLRGRIRKMRKAGG